jgi:1,4-dihydroxy-2-naphthoate octaprenyltransferase
LLLPFGLELALIYTCILLLSLGYSHPRTRWKGHPFKSLAVVGTGQGVLDFTAGVLTANLVIARTGETHTWQLVLWFGLIGATLTVLAFYPLTQLYQLSDDTRRGDRTIAAWLHARGEQRAPGGRHVVFRFALLLFVPGSCCNALALWFAGEVTLSVALASFSVSPLIYLAVWSRDHDISQATDFARIHFLMRAMAAGFGTFIAYVLLRGGL